MTNAIRIFQKGTRSAVVIDGTVTEKLEVNTDVLEGDLSVLYFFIVVIDWLMRNADIDGLGFMTRTPKSRRIPEKQVGDLGYVDDISLLRNETKNAQIQLNALSDVAKDVGPR